MKSTLNALSVTRIILGLTFTLTPVWVGLMWLVLNLINALVAGLLGVATPSATAAPPIPTHVAPDAEEIALGLDPTRSPADELVARVEQMTVGDDPLATAWQTTARLFLLRTYAAAPSRPRGSREPLVSDLDTYLAAYEADPALGGSARPLVERARDSALAHAPAETTITVRPDSLSITQLAPAPEDLAWVKAVWAELALQHRAVGVSMSAAFSSRDPEMVAWCLDWAAELLASQDDVETLPTCDFSTSLVREHFAEQAPHRVYVAFYVNVYRAGL